MYIKIDMMYRHMRHKFVNIVHHKIEINIEESVFIIIDFLFVRKSKNINKLLPFICRSVERKSVLD